MGDTKGTLMSYPPGFTLAERRAYFGSGDDAHDPECNCRHCYADFVERALYPSEDDKANDPDVIAFRNKRAAKLRAKRAARGAK